MPAYVRALCCRNRSHASRAPAVWDEQGTSPRSHGNTSPSRQPSPLSPLRQSPQGRQRALQAERLRRGGHSLPSRRAHEGAAGPALQVTSAPVPVHLLDGPDPALGQESSLETTAATPRARKGLVRWLGDSFSGRTPSSGGAQRSVASARSTPSPLVRARAATLVHLHSPCFHACADLLLARS